MKNWGLFLLGTGIVGLGIWWLAGRATEPRWQRGEQPARGITVVDVQLEEETGRYVYWLEFDERPSRWYGPLTEEEVLAQLPSALPSALIEAGLR